MIAADKIIKLPKLTLTSNGISQPNMLSFTLNIWPPTELGNMIYMLPIYCPSSLTVGVLIREAAAYLGIETEDLYEFVCNGIKPPHETPLGQLGLTDPKIQLFAYSRVRIDRQNVGKNATQSLKQKKPPIVTKTPTTQSFCNPPLEFDSSFVEPSDMIQFVVCINEPQKRTSTTAIRCSQYHKIGDLLWQVLNGAGLDPESFQIKLRKEVIALTDEQPINALDIKDGDTVNLQIRPVAKSIKMQQQNNYNNINLNNSDMNPYIEDQSNMQVRPEVYQTENQAQAKATANSNTKLNKGYNNVSKAAIPQTANQQGVQTGRAGVIHLTIVYNKQQVTVNIPYATTLTSIINLIRKEFNITPNMPLRLVSSTNGKKVYSTQEGLQTKPLSNLFPKHEKSGKIVVCPIQIVQVRPINPIQKTTLQGSNAKRPTNQQQHNQKIIQTKYKPSPINIKSNPILVNNEGFNITELSAKLLEMTANRLNQQSYLKNIQAPQQKNVVITPLHPNKIVPKAQIYNILNKTPYNQYQTYQTTGTCRPQNAFYYLQHNNALNVNPGRRYNVMFIDDYGGKRNFVVDPRETLGQVIGKLQQENNLNPTEKPKLYYDGKLIDKEKMQKKIESFGKDTMEIKVSGVKINNKPNNILNMGNNNPGYQNKIFNAQINNPIYNQQYNQINNQYVDRNLLIPKYVPIPPSEPKVDLRRIKHPKGKITIFYKTSDEKIEKRWDFKTKTTQTLGDLKKRIEEAGGNPNIIWFKQNRINTKFNSVPLGQIFMEPKIYILGGVAKEKTIQQPNNINNLQFGNRLFNINPNYNQQYNQNNNQNANRNLLIPKYVPIPPSEPKVDLRRIKHPKGKITIFYKTSDGKIEKRWDFDKDKKLTLGDLKTQIKEAGGDPDIIWFKKYRINTGFNDVPLGQIFMEPKIYILGGVAKEKTIQQPNNINNFQFGNRLFNFYPIYNQKQLKNKQSKRILKKIYTIDQ